MYNRYFFYTIGSCEIMGALIGSGSLPTYRGLEIDSTLFLLSECDIRWFLVEPDIGTRVKR